MTPDDELRRLVLLRHGKSAYPPGVGDHQRPLAARGEREAGLAGEWIRAHLPPVDLVLCSTAARTRQTVAAAAVSAPITYADDIYGAYPDELLDLVRAHGGGHRTVLVVGHAPGLPDLAEDLAGAGSDRDALARVRTKFPTSAIAVLHVRGEWSELGEATARLVQCAIPRAAKVDR